ncbi:class I SAM-dependent methyltransferase [Novosphingobium sp.]|uniref:class I SAM-dependent methyltransferase n=1 Tax=Novosphingobium sp. TaxID=1874826 RepID=UPI0025F2C91F|nr:class I SAM-dependent methyltransferase [Novosphingobium sp.]
MASNNDVNTAPIARERLASACVCCGSDDLAASPAILMPFVAHRAFGWAPVEIDESWGLKTIQSGMAYSICKTLRCRKCDHLFCDIRFSDAEMNAIYAGYREEVYVALRDHYEPGYAKRNEGLVEVVSYKPAIEAFLDPYLQDPLTILDWGGDTGSNTPYEQRRTVLDIFDISGKDVVPGARVVTLEQATSAKYRLVICGQLLEHTPYPSDVLAAARKAMDAESVLYIEVPFEAIMQADVANRETVKRHWHEHVNFYTPSSMRGLLESGGFEVLDQGVLEISIGGGNARILQVACRLA